jgi:hypothetical protein
MTPSNIINSFKKTGLVPFDASVVLSQLTNKRRINQVSVGEADSPSIPLDLPSSSRLKKQLFRKSDAAT